MGGPYFGPYRGVPILSMNADDANRRAGALFKKEQQLREAQQAMAEYQAGLRAMREKTARLRALRLARDAANQSTPGRGVIRQTTTCGYSRSPSAHWPGPCLRGICRQLDRLGD